MKYRMVLLAALAVLAVSSSLGCGLLGGGSGDGLDEMVLLEFEESGPGPGPAPEPGGEEAQPVYLAFNQEILVEVRYLYHHQVQLESFRQLVRDLLSLLEYSNDAEIDLEWVIEVHEVTEEADELFDQLTSFRVPHSQRVQYEDFYIGLLEAVQVTALGSSRVLDASFQVGPSGRSLAVMSRPEREEFFTLMREAAFYLRDSERLVERQLQDVGGVVSRIRLR